MPKDTPSMAKNKIRRSLAAILDPHPSTHEVAELWSYFDSSCAYCGLSLARADRNGHLDHVVASAQGGGNGIHNHILACWRCNGDEKREEDWRSFLSRKVPDVVVAGARQERIEAWIGLRSDSDADPAVSVAAQEIIAEALEQFDASVRRMRALRT